MEVHNSGVSREGHAWPSGVGWPGLGWSRRFFGHSSMVWCGCAIFLLQSGMIYRLMNMSGAVANFLPLTCEGDEADYGR